ncbi:DUF2218 domain-containing protein [Gilvimarinus agarilyticus]|uniref:DUF2218 domain-containing protein n=1 Tax=Gilvimarinus agarilyticus TaxID=679259 RepID=UPI001E32F3ED|nr:DUF2218 domain-containing protein [Gilvimarinus agarilyticus]
MSSRASLVLTTPARTLHRLCKHFSHKVTARWQDNTGHVDFAIGECTLTATTEQLQLTCWARSYDELREIEQTLERHIGPMSGQHQQPPKLIWHR